MNSPAALPKFQEVYGFTLTPDQLVTLSGGDTAATIAAAAQQTNGVNAAMVYGTDGGIAPSGLTVLEDDKGVQPVIEHGRVGTAHHRTVQLKHGDARCTCGGWPLPDVHLRHDRNP